MVLYFAPLAGTCLLTVPKSSLGCRKTISGSPELAGWRRLHIEKEVLPKAVHQLSLGLTAMASRLGNDVHELFMASVVRLVFKITEHNNMYRLLLEALFDTLGKEPVAAGRHEDDRANV